jgi:neuroligin
MVFVHGESWSWGSANLYDARVLATLGKVVVVTFNYRLGILGNALTNKQKGILFII